MTEVYRSVEDLLSARGHRLGPGEGLLVDQDTIDGFARATSDMQWIHVDTERAAREHRATIAHGLLTLSLIVPLVEQLRRVEVGEAINYGFDRVRFLAPVASETVLRAECEIEDVQASPTGTKVRTAVAISAASTGDPVCVAQWWTFYPGLTAPLSSEVAA